MSHPKLACCNFIPDVKELRRFALHHGFEGMDWSFDLGTVPRSPAEVSSFGRTISHLHPLEVRYHCPFERTDLGDDEEEAAEKASKIYRRICRLLSNIGGRFVTIHVGLGLDSTTDLSWDRTLKSLTELVDYADNLGIRLCLENLGWGWTSRPQLFEKLIRRTNTWATLDIGHARISPHVVNQHFRLEDFVTPQAERFLNAHIYHEEAKNRHLSPPDLPAIEDRLRLLTKLPRCDWWVLELREERALLETLAVVREFFHLK